ncbi:hypothetical protein F5Y06DRAFT_306684 [Hypoxylon sp. FL0890]|nr:hypothetical protein F5Y06DRAFT_306684 [Hypoxylon sp. FL0890]
MEGEPFNVCGPPDIILSMRFWDSVFPEAMARFEKTFEEPKNRRDIGYSIRGLGNWDQVYRQLESCYTKYMDDTGLGKKVQKGWREFADKIDPIRQAWKLVPDIDYITPIRGTLQFLMDAIKRASDTRQKILHGLDELDSMFIDIELFLIIFPTEPNVREAGTDLVVSALMAVEKLIGFYLKHKGRKALSALFKGDDYEKDVISSLHDITSKSESLRYEATKADMSQSAKNWQIAKQRHKELIEWQAVLKKGQTKIIENQDSHAANLARTFQDGMQTINDNLTGIFANLIMEYERNQEQRAQQLQERNATLEREVSELKYTAQSLQRALTPDPAARDGWCLTPDDIWDMFGSFCFEDRDMQHILDKQETIPSHERAISETLVTNPRFREWMVSPSSSELLVQGDSTSRHQISSQSVFCSTFLQALRANPMFISLVYFCGLHADFDSLYSGPRFMMMSFLAQLVLQWDFDTASRYQPTEFLRDGYGREAEMDDLCDLVSSLIIKLPAETTVFFVIDGINAFERDGFLQDLIDGLACILDLTIDARIRTTVKVLVTSPGRTFEVRGGFHDDAVLVMGSQLGLGREANQRQLQHRVSRVLESN